MPEQFPSDDPKQVEPEPDNVVAEVPVASIASEGPVIAELAEPADSLAAASVFSPTKRLSTPPPVPEHLRNLAANGGAVAALVLGVLAVVGAFFSELASINALMGILFAWWGFQSQMKKTCRTGLVLCLLSLGLCVFFYARIGSS